MKYRDRSIADVLHMTIEEADEFFKDIPPIKDKTAIMKVGLGYLRAGTVGDHAFGRRGPAHQTRQNWPAAIPGGRSIFSTGPRRGCISMISVSCSA